MKPKQKKGDVVQCDVCSGFFLARTYQHKYCDDCVGKTGEIRAKQAYEKERANRRKNTKKRCSAEGCNEPVRRRVVNYQIIEDICKRCFQYGPPSAADENRTYMNNRVLV